MKWKRCSYAAEVWPNEASAIMKKRLIQIH